jgi:serine/threonine-protein kinase PknG
MPRCPRPGCAGEFEDGYCNLCGHAVSRSAPKWSSAVSSIEHPRGGSASAEGMRCAHPGCEGTVEDGYCTVSGHKALAAEGNGPFAGRTGPAQIVPDSYLQNPGSALSRDTGTARLHFAGSPATSRTAGAAVGGGGGWNRSAGLVAIPSAPYRDPLSAVLTNPEVPEGKRQCAQCGEPVGRTRAGRPGRTEGFCSHCGGAYSFSPKLWAGDLVAGQYEVMGCLAHGGLGWVYLARDKHLFDKWVVLKGLLDSTDESAREAAIAERRFLAEVKHANIVKIHNFVQHENAGYIVMEYVGGESLREVRLRHRQEFGALLPVAQAIAYVLEILPAFAYLHGRRLLYCDFKPDNVIQTEDQLTLIDLGAVRAVDDPLSAVYGTVGYQAPEVPDDGASVTSDLYTVARTLAILCLDIRGFTDEQRFVASLPSVSDEPLFGRYRSFYDFLSKATHMDPGARFQSADEMADQLIGVLRQVLAIDGGHPAPASSLLFSPELGHGTHESSWRNLPIPAVDPADAAAGLLATLSTSGPDQIRAALESAPPSPELVFRRARSWIDEGAFVDAEAELDSPEVRAEGWRVAWWRGVLNLAAGRPKDAEVFLGAVAAELPGELAPKLALAVSFELSSRADPGESVLGAHAVRTTAVDDGREAARYYQLVAATNPGYVSASFGLSRICLDLGDRAGAVEALESIPVTSSAHVGAQVALCRIRCADVAGARPELGDLVSASDVLDSLPLEPSLRLPLVRDLLTQGLALLADGTVRPDTAVFITGTAFDDVDLRSALEITYRSLAKMAPTDEERFTLVDRANAYRPRTLT